MTHSELLHRVLRILQATALLLALGAAPDALAQKTAAKTGSAPVDVRLTMAINEGGAANADAAETLFKYRELSEVIEKQLGVTLLIVAVRDRNKLKNALQKHDYALLLARPNDVPAEAVRDFGYQPVVMEKIPSRTLFIVPKNSPLKTLADVKGKTIVTPDAYSNMWRVANAMLRDTKITMTDEKVKSMRDQAAIGWSMENGFFDVGVINSVSGVGRTWEKSGGRVIAASPELPNLPMIASPALSESQVAKVRSALVALDSTDEGRAILKKIGASGFQPASRQALLDFLAWIGDLPQVKQ